MNDPRRSITCPTCGAHIEISNLGGETPPALLPAQKRPAVIGWITFFGVLSALWGLWYSDLWSAMPAAHDRYQVFSRVCAYINFPLDSLLLATSIALLTPAREWGRKGILLWAVVASVFQTLVVFITMAWISPVATLQDVPPDLAQALPLISGTPGQAITGDATFAWISIMFLSTWIGWALTRQKIKPYFQATHAAPSPKIS